MSSNRNGPPEECEVPAHRGTGTRHDRHVDTANGSRRPATASKPQQRICGSTDVVSQLRARRLSSYRLAPLDCGCRDTWTCRRMEPPLSERALDGWREAAQHILHQTTDAAPLLPVEVLQALYRRGGADRELAEQLHELTGGLVT
jgi:hypothetical protein